MRIKMNDRGLTLVELIIAVALLSGVMATIYYFFGFSMKSHYFVQEHYQAELNARRTVMSMADDIRKAKSVMIGATRHLAVEVSNGGMTLNVYTDTDNDGTMELVSYKVEDKQLKMGTAELGNAPADWTVLADKIFNASATPVVPAFTISGKQVGIKLEIKDENSSLDEAPVSVVTSISVRSKGAME